MVERRSSPIAMVGLTKIWARPELCADKNHDGEIATAQGSEAPLAFDEEECIAWTIDFCQTSLGAAPGRMDSRCPQPRHL